MNIADMIAPIDIDQLDPGIRRLVTILSAAGFDTTDSGDGVTKLATLTAEEIAELGDDAPLDAPHVFISSDRSRMADESDRLLKVLRRRAPHAFQADGEPRDNVSVEASYSPADGVAILMVIGISDADIEPVTDGLS